MKKRAIVRVGGLLAAAGLLLAIGSAGALDNDAIPAGQAFAQAAAGMAMYGVGLAIAKIAGAKKKRDAAREHDVSLSCLVLVLFQSTHLREMRLRTSSARTLRPYYTQNKRGCQDDL